MSTFLLTVGVFLGGAAPWLEAVVVIPVGIVAGLNPVVTVIAGAVGNLITVGIAAWFGERIRQWWMRRRERKKRAKLAVAATPGNASGAAAEPADAGPADEPTPSKRSERITRLVQRWGLLPLAALGPIGLGTQISAVVAVGLGISARTAFIWVGAGTIAWSIAAAILAVTGLNLFGVGDV